MVYYTKKVRGSDAYWHLKRAELYTWINHHIDEQHGAPNLFITLSCAEYFWPDIKRLLEDRILVAENREVDLDSNHTAKVKAVNDYSIVVQQYFHKRVEKFLNTVGKELFGIRHYWLRYEFAKSRGQIHCHLLAITSDCCDPNGITAQLFASGKDRKTQAELLGQWVDDRFELSAEMPEVPCPDDDDEGGDYAQPCSMRLSEVTDCLLDMFRLATATQLHKCNDYCMRSPKQKNDGINGQKRNCDKSQHNTCRFCRMGAGTESSAGNAQTPGWERKENTEIVRDDRGFLKLLLKRTNNKRLLQTSFDLLQCWRANCNIQVLLYDTDPKHPDPAEIAKVTDYIVAYATKGNATMAVEKSLVTNFILR